MVVKNRRPEIIYASVLEENKSGEGNFHDNQKLY
jgi:hypothetical protein